MNNKMAVLDENNVAHADPQKSFFIDMLTKDIGAMECILDLIDNSIHNLIEINKLDVMEMLLVEKRSIISSNRKIEIQISKSEFIITDNCGGIEKKDAINNVFLFGKKESPETMPGLGLYGIGMKRAFFKIGKLIELTSKTKTDYFQIIIDVDEWKQNDKWWFPINNKPEKNIVISPGVKIVIKSINDEIRHRIDTVKFINDLISKISSVYALFLRAGLVIEVNGTKVENKFPEFETKSATPARKIMVLNGVNVLLTAGLSPKKNKNPQGWYIFCNGRMVIEADQTIKTGWGHEKYPLFRPKFNHFLGIVFFYCKNPELLPWRTTKDDIVQESTVYQATLAEMKIQARPIINELNRLYPNDDEEEAVMQREIFQDSNSTQVIDLPKNSRQFSINRNTKNKPSSDVIISFKKPRIMVEEVKTQLNNIHISNTKLGEMIFDYYYKKEVD